MEYTVVHSAKLETYKLLSFAVGGAGDVSVTLKARATKGIFLIGGFWSNKLRKVKSLPDSNSGK